MKDKIIKKWQDAELVARQSYEQYKGRLTPSQLIDSERVIKILESVNYDMGILING